MIIAAAILLEVMGAAQYVMATYGTESELMSKANRDMEKSQSVAAVKSEVESALRNIHKAAEMSLNIDAVGVFHLAHHEGTLNGGQHFDFAQLVEHERLVLLHVSCPYLQQIVIVA